MAASDKNGASSLLGPGDLVGVNRQAPTTETSRNRLAGWVAREVMPHEPAVRAWLRQRGRTPEDIDDLIQEAYAKLASLTALEAVARPGGYFFQIVRNLLIDHIRRSKVVRIDAVGEIGDLPGHADDLNPERITSDRNELAQVLALIETLPPRCREIFKMRKIEGLSQREIAQRLNVTESVVENDAVKGLALLVRAMATRSPHFDGGRP